MSPVHSLLALAVRAAAILALTMASAQAQEAERILDAGTLRVVLDGEVCHVIDRAAGRVVRRERDLVIRLLDESFDPLVADLAASAASPGVWAPASAAPSRLRIVQLEAPSLPAWRERLCEAGAEIVAWIPAQAHVVRADPEVFEELARLPFVRWIGPVEPRWKIGTLVVAGDPRERLAIEVMTCGADRAEKERIAAFVRELGGVLIRPVPARGRRLTVSLERRFLLRLLARDDVLFVDRHGPMAADVDQARVAVGAASLELAEGFAGAGVRGQVRDFGLDLGHPEVLAAPPIPHLGAMGPTFHGTPVYGILFARGVGNALARGLLPAGQGVFLAEALSVDRYAETAQLLLPPFRCVFESSSIGSPVSSDYGVVSADLDFLLFEIDLAVCQSQSNTGNQDSRPEAWAKNVISVGGVRHGDTAAFGDDSWTGVASIGPAADGRIKPDLVSFADFVLAPVPLLGYTPAFGGTSAATPIVAGALGLLHEIWADGAFGNALVSWDPFENRPHMTTAKALLLNAARPYPFSGLAHDLTRTHQGWGQPDVQALFDRSAATVVIDESVVLGALGLHQATFDVAAGEPSLDVTLTWADPPAAPMAAVHRVNDLDLRAIAPSGAIHRGNAFLRAGNVSLPGGQADAIDTVERIVVPLPEAGTWTFEVEVAALNADGRPETAAADVDFALVIAGVDPGPGPVPDVGQANRPDAALLVRDAVNLNGRRPRLGEPGPFFVARAPGETVELVVEAAAFTPFALIVGPLHRGNVDFGGAGRLDVGVLGPSLSDLSLLLDGIGPRGFFDLLAITDGLGRQSLAFGVPLAPPGLTFALQAVTFDATVPAAALSAATEIEIE